MLVLLIGTVADLWCVANVKCCQCDLTVPNIQVLPMYRCCRSYFGVANVKCCQSDLSVANMLVLPIETVADVWCVAHVKCC